MMTPGLLAQAFHEAYERLAPSFGYKTRDASAKPWRDVPEQNKALMIAVSAEMLALVRGDSCSWDPSGRQTEPLPFQP